MLAVSGTNLLARRRRTAMNGTATMGIGRRRQTGRRTAHPLAFPAYPSNFHARGAKKRCAPYVGQRDRGPVFPGHPVGKFIKIRIRLGGAHISGGAGVLSAWHKCPADLADATPIAERVISFASAIER